MKTFDPMIQEASLARTGWQYDGLVNTGAGYIEMWRYKHKTCSFHYQTINLRGKIPTWLKTGVSV
jgi:hypothetical protein